MNNSGHDDRAHTDVLDNGGVTTIRLVIGAFLGHNR